MVDKLSDLFKEIKIRVTNPFISSYILSWIVCNWKIVIALFSYDREDYNALNFSGFIHYFYHHSDRLTLLVYPLISSLVYTFVFPLFKNLITYTHAWIYHWWNKEVLKVTEKSWVETSKYLELRDLYRAKINQISQLIKDESVTTVRNTELTQQVTDLQAENASLSDENNKMSESLRRERHENAELRNQLDSAVHEIRDLNDFVARKQSLEAYESYLAGTWKGNVFSAASVDVTLSVTKDFILVNCEQESLEFGGRIELFKVSMVSDYLELLAVGGSDKSPRVLHFKFEKDLMDDRGRKVIRGFLNNLKVTLRLVE